MITVATYNIHKAHSMTRGCHLNELKSGLKEMDADLICLQEVQDINTKRKSPILIEHGHSQVAALQANLYPHSAYGANAIYEHGHHGNAILSKYPIEQWRNIDVSDHRLEQRGVLHATLDHPVLGEVHVINSHFGLFKVSRIRQAYALIRYVRCFVPPHAPLIVAGDFNDWNLYVHHILTRELLLQDAIETIQRGLKPHVNSESNRLRRLVKNLTNTALAPTPFGTPKTVGRTFPSMIPWFKLDRLYVRGFEIAEAHVKMGAEWRNRSDHAPIQATLKPALILPPSMKP